MAGWRLTIRHGSKVKRERFASLEEAVDELRRRAEAISHEDALSEVRMLRTYESGDRVRARLELSGPRWLRGPEAGVDVRGDGRVVPYRGAIFRQELEPRPGQSAYDAVLDSLRGRVP